MSRTYAIPDCADRGQTWPQVIIPSPAQVEQRRVLLPKQAEQRVYSGPFSGLRLVVMRPCPPQDGQVERPDPWHR
ncbi:MAG: hypothetical protein ACU0GG_16220 [Paracoccaceae bacterium]